MTERNPLYIPGKTAKPQRACPKCGSLEWAARNRGGVFLYTCNAPTCGFKWPGGGLPQVPQDPNVPTPIGSYIPPVVFHAIRNKDGDIIEVEEINRKVDLTADFRKGALIPPDGDEE
jgi:predicted RNA-binding Zn-ribbon protein involved in translation (DUF1610 family)